MRLGILPLTAFFCIWGCAPVIIPSSVSPDTNDEEDVLPADEPIDQPAMEPTPPRTIPERVRSACPGVTDPMIRAKIVSIAAERLDGVPIGGSRGVLYSSEIECSNLCFNRPSCDSACEDLCNAECYACDAAIVDLVYDPPVSAFNRITPDVEDACAGIPTTQIAAKITFIQSQDDLGVPIGGSQGVLHSSEIACSNLCFNLPSCASACEDLCNAECYACDAAIVDLVYGD